MISLNNLRTTFGAVVIAVIAFALVGFILGDFLGNRNQGQDPIVGEINGEEIPYSTFYAAYQEVKVLSGNQEYDMTDQYIQTAWQLLLFDRVLVPNMKKLGLQVTEAEREKVLRGELSSNILNANFGVEGQYDKEMLRTFLDEIEGNAEAQVYWNALDNQIWSDRVVSKYADLVRSGAYVNSLTVERSLAVNNNTYKGRYVACDYSSIADSLVTVSDSEINSYYEANKAKYEQAPYRAISYAYFRNEASAEDKAAIEKEAKSAAEGFAAAQDLEKYMVGKRYVRLADNYVSADALSTEEGAALGAGKMFGPELRGNEWYASRVSDVIVAPKSVEMQQIVLYETESQLADSLYLAVKTPGASFEALAPEGRFADFGEISCSTLPAEWLTLLANAKANDIIKANIGGAIRIIKVSKVGEKTRHYRLITQKHGIYSSQETKDALYKEAREFARVAKASANGFNEAAKSHPISSVNVEKSHRNIMGVPNSIEVVRWVNEAAVGATSELIKINGEDYIIATVTEIDDNEYKSVDDVRDEIKALLVNRKKAELLKAKMTGATIEEIAANAGSTVKEFSDAKVSSNNISGIGVEPRVAGALSAVSADGKGKFLPIIEGSHGVYVIIVDDIATDETQTADAERVKIQAQMEYQVVNGAIRAISKAADIKDNTVSYL